MATSSPSSHQASEEHYDVFLSFRGQDARGRNFASQLYEALYGEGISTIFDNEFSREVNNSSSILLAIERSTISIIVFSENYARSELSLMELDKILECNRFIGQIVIPVFYGVTPSEVRNQTVANLEEILDLRRIRSNLAEAADIRGWELQTLRCVLAPDESEFIGKIVRDTSNKLNQMRRNYPATLLGIESPAVPPKVVLKYFTHTNLVLEIVLVTLDQSRSAQKPLYSLLILVVALSAMMVCLGELVYKARHRNITLKWNGMRCKIIYPLLDYMPFFTWFDVFSLVSAICQLVFATVGYSYSRQHKESPIKVSLVALILIICKQWRSYEEILTECLRCID